MAVPVLHVCDKFGVAGSGSLSPTSEGAKRGP